MRPSYFEWLDEQVEYELLYILFLVEIFYWWDDGWVEDEPWRSQMLWVLIIFPVSIHVNL
ncbi:MAG TPA: hypothetical protein VGN00_24680 [Puia sp.]|jgi:hypothetical protein